MKPRTMWAVALSAGDGWTLDGAVLASTRQDAIAEYEAGGWDYAHYHEARKAGDALAVKLIAIEAHEYSNLRAENTWLHAKVAGLIDELEGLRILPEPTP